MQQTRARRTRRAILDAAAEVFGRQGYDGTALTDILRAAGVTKGALYFHFTSKQQVAEVVLEEEAVAWAALAARAKELGPRGLQGLIDFSYAVARLLHGSTAAHAGVRLRREVGVFDGPWGAPERSCVVMVRGYLARALADRELRAGVDCDAAAEAIVAAVIGAQLLAERVAEGPGLEDRLTSIWRMLLPTLAADPRPYRLTAAPTEKPARAPEPARDPDSARAPDSARDPGSVRVPGSARDPDSVRASESVRDPELARHPGSVRDPGSVREPDSARDPGSVREPEPSRATEPVCDPESAREPGSVRVPDSPRLPRPPVPPQPVSPRPAAGAVPDVASAG
ncbi:ScbR family autoregulator-binding transcription factor [Streptomyces johnsoniae]|uniref:ScbR family autoregulator-binding transcription factor n=1 Tax=Streptomyces johnsoniae TaxID=3075532 RepID=A0ABU2SCC6_9ACTN|nr:ScbR family autoregulator-binding transcription factor [Streptomyces sp. DSM 41886]MDT0446631.1 ScbR family autoregulator-binding transcription factor [Streptomyces sp. DSM 41886]